MIGSTKPYTVTICGSMKYLDIMNEIKKELERKFVIVHMPNLAFTKEEIAKFSEEEMTKLHEMHYTKMRESDYVYIVNPGGYIGDDTMREINYCKDHNIELKWYCDPDEEDAYIVLTQVQSETNEGVTTISIAGIYRDKETADKLCSELGKREGAAAIVIRSKSETENPVYDSARKETATVWDVLKFKEGKDS